MIVIDVPLTHLLQAVGSDGAPGPVTEQKLDQIDPAAAVELPE